MLCQERKKTASTRLEYSDFELDSEEPRTPTPVEIRYNISLSCYKVINNNFPRRYYMSCINRSKLVGKIYTILTNI